MPITRPYGGQINFVPELVINFAVALPIPLVAKVIKAIFFIF